MKTRNKTHFFSIMFFLFLMLSVNAQADKNSELYHNIMYNDSLLFHEGFNNCKISVFEDLLTEDLEFYHDKSGIENSKSEFVNSMKNGICNPDNTEKIYRYVVPGSIEVFPLYDNGILYGALQNGRHFFSQKSDMTYEMSDNSALFSHLWLLENKSWKLKRVLSYNHVSKDVQISIESVSVSTDILESYTGHYIAPKSGNVHIYRNEDNLTLKAGKMNSVIKPSSETIFFHQQAPLTFEFVVTDSGEVEKMIVRENGNIVEEAIKQ